ncbi:chaplin family protein [Dactylosporangium sp. NPDC051541]|uniref:chaplin family protein n=1 Tax=Dactylosporangium sp. NPDC051541 TaxID=3363977 RepID=UPI0037AE652A
MNRWLIRSVQIAALAMGGLALTGTAAHADNWSGPNVGFFNGNQSSTTIQMPTNICGNSIAIIGFASANCDGGAYAYNGDGGSYSGAGSNGRGNGNGYRNGDGNANANSVSNNRRHHRHHRNNNGGANANSVDDRNDYRGRSNGGNGGAVAYNDNGNWSTGGNFGIGNGNQSSFTYQAPTNVSCNSVALVGFASSC